MAGKTKTTPPMTPAKPKDFSGYRMKSGEVLDLRNAAVILTAPIRAGKGCVIKNGVFNGDALEQHRPAIEIPHGADDVTVDGCSFDGGSFNGLVVAMGLRPRITNNVVRKGSGWFCKLLEADGALIAGNHTENLRRGGLYLGDDDLPGNDNYTDQVTIRGNVFDISDTDDEEAPFRVNNGRNLLIEGNVFIGTGAKAKKESAQFRGGSGVCRGNTYIGSIALGQTPNGRPMNAEFHFTDETIYGYVLAQAGTVATFEGGSLSMAKTFIFGGKTYALSLGGGGYAFSAKRGASVLPDAKLLARGVTVIGAKSLVGGIAQAVDCKFSGKAG